MLPGRGWSWAKQAGQTTARGAPRSLALVGCADQYPAQHRHGLALDLDPAARELDADDAAAGGGLVAGQLDAIETFGPVGCQGAVRRSGDRVLVDPHRRAEEAR